MTEPLQPRSFHIRRYPPTSNRSLKAWSAADEYLLQEWAAQADREGQIAIWNDRFGYLGTHLHTHTPFRVISYHSQETALRNNLRANGLALDEEKVVSVLADLPQPIRTGLIRVPKSLELFRLYLRQAAAALVPQGLVLAGFMTRHFSPQLLTIAGQYFGQVEQSLAWKKSRLMILKQPVADPPELALAQIEVAPGWVMQQYPGVFSANQVDPATRFFLEHLILEPSDQRILDLGTGNGIIAAAIERRSPGREWHLIDDSLLAVASARLNLSAANAQFHVADTLEAFAVDFFDLVLSNPPFHLEHENNIEVSLRLFREVHRCLRPGGRFQLVANRHLGYRTHLSKWFPEVRILAENEKFVIYVAHKGSDHASGGAVN